MPGTIVGVYANERVLPTDAELVFTLKGVKSNGKIAK
jgi:hypothetical protein